MATEQQLTTYVSIRDTIARHFREYREIVHNFEQVFNNPSIPNEVLLQVTNGRDPAEIQKEYLQTQTNTTKLLIDYITYLTNMTVSFPPADVLSSFNQTFGLISRLLIDRALFPAHLRSRIVLRCYSLSHAIFASLTRVSPHALLKEQIIDPKSYKALLSFFTSLLPDEDRPAPSDPAAAPDETVQGSTEAVLPLLGTLHSLLLLPLLLPAQPPAASLLSELAAGSLVPALLTIIHKLLALAVSPRSQPSVSVWALEALIMVREALGGEAAATAPAWVRYLALRQELDALEAFVREEGRGGADPSEDELLSNMKRVKGGEPEPEPLLGKTVPELSQIPNSQIERRLEHIRLSLHRHLYTLQYSAPASLFSAPAPDSDAAALLAARDSHLRATNTLATVLPGLLSHASVLFARPRPPQALLAAATRLFTGAVAAVCADRELAVLGVHPGLGLGAARNQEEKDIPDKLVGVPVGVSALLSKIKQQQQQATAASTVSVSPPPSSSPAAALLQAFPAPTALTSPAPASLLPPHLASLPPPSLAPAAGASPLSAALARGLHHLQAAQDRIRSRPPDAPAGGGADADRGLLQLLAGGADAGAGAEGSGARDVGVRTGEWLAETKMRVSQLIAVIFAPFSFPSTQSPDADDQPTPGSSSVVAPARSGVRALLLSSSFVFLSHCPVFLTPCVPPLVDCLVAGLYAPEALVAQRAVALVRLMHRSGLLAKALTPVADAAGVRSSDEKREHDSGEIKAGAKSLLALISSKTSPNQENSQTPEFSGFPFSASTSASVHRSSPLALLLELFRSRLQWLPQLLQRADSRRQALALQMLNGYLVLLGALPAPVPGAEAGAGAGAGASSSLLASLLAAHGPRLLESLVGALAVDGEDAPVTEVGGDDGDRGNEVEQVAEQLSGFSSSGFISPRFAHIRDPQVVSLLLQLCANIACYCPAPALAASWLPLLGEALARAAGQWGADEALAAEDVGAGMGTGTDAEGDAGAGAEQGAGGDAAIVSPARTSVCVQEVIDDDVSAPAATSTSLIAAASASAAVPAAGFAGLPASLIHTLQVADVTDARGPGDKFARSSGKNKSPISGSACGSSGRLVALCLLLSLSLRGLYSAHRYHDVWQRHLREKLLHQQQLRAASASATTAPPPPAVPAFLLAFPLPPPAPTQSPAPAALPALLPGLLQRMLHVFTLPVVPSAAASEARHFITNISRKNQHSGKSWNPDNYRSSLLAQSHACRGIAYIFHLFTASEAHHHLSLALVPLLAASIPPLAYIGQNNAYADGNSKKTLGQLKTGLGAPDVSVLQSSCMAALSALSRRLLFPHPQDMVAACLDAVISKITVQLTKEKLKKDQEKVFFKLRRKKTLDMNELPSEVPVDTSSAGSSTIVLAEAVHQCQLAYNHCRKQYLLLSSAAAPAQVLPLFLSALRHWRAASAHALLAARDVDVAHGAAARLPALLLATLRMASVSRAIAARAEADAQARSKSGVSPPPPSAPARTGSATAAANQADLFVLLRPVLAQVLDALGDSHASMQDIPRALQREQPQDQPWGAGTAAGALKGDATSVVGYSSFAAANSDVLTAPSGAPAVLRGNRGAALSAPDVHYYLGRKRDCERQLLQSLTVLSAIVHAMYERALAVWRRREQLWGDEYTLRWRGRQMRRRWVQTWDEIHGGGGDGTATESESAQPPASTAVALNAQSSTAIVPTSSTSLVIASRALSAPSPLQALAAALGHAPGRLSASPHEVQQLSSTMAQGLHVDPDCAVALTAAGVVVPRAESMAARVASLRDRVRLRVQGIRAQEEERERYRAIQRGGGGDPEVAAEWWRNMLAAKDEEKTRDERLGKAVMADGDIEMDAEEGRATSDVEYDSDFDEDIIVGKRMTRYVYMH
jgi:hypothetical protein